MILRPIFHCNILIDTAVKDVKGGNEKSILRAREGGIGADFGIVMETR